MNKFTLDIGKPWCGWVNISFLNDNKEFMSINASGVYNPFYELVDFLKDISKHKSGTFFWTVDQEGYDGEVKVTIQDNYIILETETDTEVEKLPSFKIKYKKSDFLYIMKCNLTNYYNENKKIIIDDCYPLDFNINELRKIKW